MHVNGSTLRDTKNSALLRLMMASKDVCIINCCDVCYDSGHFVGPRYLQLMQLSGGSIVNNNDKDKWSVFCHTIPSLSISPALP